MTRFVMLNHDHPLPHIDLMLEVGATLWTWRLAEVPPAGRGLTAMRIGNHRLAYLEYEGPVSGGRGTVSRHDYGTFEMISGDESRVEVILNGRRIQGRLVLERGSGEEWLALLFPASA